MLAKNVFDMVVKMTARIKSISYEFSPRHLFMLGETRKSFKLHFELIAFAGETVHFDVVGPLPVNIKFHHYSCMFLYQ